MTAYIVRVIATGELVGLYAAQTVNGLIRAVDEVCDAGLCEYANLPSGGLHFSQGAPVVPLNRWNQDDGDVDPAKEMFERAYTSCGWDLEKPRRFRALGRPQ